MQALRFFADRKHLIGLPKQKIAGCDITPHVDLASLILSTEHVGVAATY